jgi:type IV pilus assembly protein PilA
LWRKCEKRCCNCEKACYNKVTNLIKKFLEEEIIMKKIQKSKKGFTLIEMILVIAIIVILAAVLALGISTYLQKAEKTASSISEHNQSISSVSAIINNYV